MTDTLATNSSEESLKFCQSAVDKVAELILEEDDPSLNLRVYITGGGCSGFQYGFTFDQSINEDDAIFEKTSTSGDCQVKLIVDSLSFQYLENAEIDYREDLQGAQFVIRNPNAKTTCGCGSSFSINEEED